MTTLRVFAVLAIAAALSGCAAVDTASRSAGLLPLETAASPLTDLPRQGHEVEAEPYNVTAVNVIVPETLTVSEANTYFPKADIVWREDPLGDRHEQVRAIVQSAAERGAAAHTAGRDVLVGIQVIRFHALTEKTRYTIGGTHDIHFYLTVRDAATGAKLGAPRRIETELKAFGGAAALKAMSRGETQKVRITEHLSALIDGALGMLEPLADGAAGT